MLRAAGVCFMFLLAMAVVSKPALAVPPVIVAVTEEDRHPLVLFQAPRASSVTVYIASAPDRATDGSFLEENIVASGSLTASEIQTGRWLDSSHIDPGDYYVMVQARLSVESCVRYDENVDRIEDSSCADGYSTLMPLTISTPETSYRVTSTVLKYIREVTLTLTADPLGDKLPYRVCWRQPTANRKASTKKCVTSTLSGYSWNEEASDSLSVSTKRMTRRTKFTWYARGDSQRVLRSRTITVY